MAALGLLLVTGITAAVLTSFFDITFSQLVIGLLAQLVLVAWLRGGRAS